MSPKNLEQPFLSFRPTPSRAFYLRMDRAPWTPSATIRRRFFAGSVVAIMLVAVLLVSTPQGRALAQQILGYFKTTAEEYFPPSFEPTRTPAPTYVFMPGLSTVQPVPAENNALCGTAISPLSSTFPCQLINAEAEVGFDIKTFSAGLLKAKFNFLFVDRFSRQVTLLFQGESALYALTQGLGDFPSYSPDPWYGVHEDAVRSVMVGSYPAEYVSGEFITRDGGGWWWYPDAPTQEIRWKEGNRWFDLAAFQLENENAEAYFIGLAESLTTVSQGIEKIAGADAPSVEEQAGFDVLEPILLPKDFYACGANYYQNDEAVFEGYALDITNVAEIFYCFIQDNRHVSGLSIYEMPASVPADLRWEFDRIVSLHLEPTMVEVVRIGGMEGQWLANDRGQALIWTQGDLKLMITYTWSSGFGGRLTKNDLISIAESLR